MGTSAFAEPSMVFEVAAVWIIPFVAYFLGIVIRNKAFPTRSSPPLFRQLLMGIPVCLVVVSPLVAALQNTIGSDWPTYLFTMGVIMEHGMLVHEEATRVLQKGVDSLAAARS